MTPTPVDPPVYPPITKLESKRGVAIIECYAFISLHIVHSNKYGNGCLSAFPSFNVDN